MASPTIFSGKRTKLLTTDGLLLSSGATLDNDGPRNYIANGKAEVSTVGWATYADAAGALPVDGTGGSPASTLTRSTTTPLRGAASFLWTKSAANRQGEGFSYDFTIDAADKAKVLQISFDYFVASGTYADADLTVYIYDVTNALIIQPSGYTIQNATVQMKQGSTTFQSASNSTSYRLIVHTASTSASAYSLQFDNFAVGPQIVTQGAAVTDWKYEVSTITASTTNPTKGTTLIDRMWWRQVGGDMEIRFEYVQTSAGTGGTGPYYFKIPNNASVDTARITSSLDMAYGGPVVGSAKAYSGSVETPGVVSLTGNALQITINSNFVGDGVSGFFAPLSNANAWYTFTAKVPILGWSSNLQLSSDTDTRVVAARAYISSGSVSIGANALIPFNATSFDTHSAFVSGSSAYRVPVPGIYEIIVDTETASSVNNLILINGGVQQRIGPNAPFGTCQAMLSLSAGDLITIFSNNAGAVTYQGTSQSTTLSVKRLSGPATIAASETVAASYYDTTGQTLSGGYTQNNIKYQTKYFDTHNAYNPTTGLYTLPISGTYRISGLFRVATAQASSDDVYLGFALNGGQQYQYKAPFGLADALGTHITGTTLIRGLAGDTIAVFEQHGPAPSKTLQNSAGQQAVFSIERIGN
jgi:hypothetical protein